MGKAEASSIMIGLQKKRMKVATNRHIGEL